MNDKFYVSLEAARLLKEKGYNEECKYIIYDDGEMFDYQYLKNQDLPKWKYSCPTKSEAIDWLESKGMTIEIHWIKFNENRRWNYAIFNCNTCDTIDIRFIFSTRLEAEEAAIIKALELL